MVGLVDLGIDTRAGGLTPPQVSDTSGQDYYQNAWTIVDLPPEDLVETLPELFGLVPATDQKPLPRLLNEVGKSVEESYQKFTEVVADERVTQVQCASSGHLTNAVHRKFSYLILTRDESGLLQLEEYRAGPDGQRVRGSRGGDFFTEGFAGMWAIFYPGNQSGSKFRYFGHLRFGEHVADVVGFREKPGWSYIIGFENIAGSRVLVMYQGVAWIDIATRQILKMRADLLKPRLDVQLELQTTEVQFGEVHISDAASTSLWVPLQVTVTTVWNGRVIRNEHQYSNYRLPGSSSTIKSAPEDISPAPKTN